MKRLATLLFLFVPMLALPPAQAADGWYASLHLGKGWKEDADMHFNSPLTFWNYTSEGREPWFSINQNFFADLSYSSGWGGGISLGRGFGNWRAEGELFWRKSRVGGFELTDYNFTIDPPDFSVPGDLGLTPLEEIYNFENISQVVNEDTAELGGKVSLLSTLLNLYYDWPVQWPLKPYIGAGLGAVHADKVKRVVLRLPPDCSPAAPCTGEDTHERSWDFTWQLMAGVRYPVADAWDVTLGWRYTSLSNLKFSLLEGESGIGVFGEDPLRVEMGDMHNVELGVTYRF